MSDETGSKKPPNFFPVILLHRAELLEPRPLLLPGG